MNFRRTLLNMNPLDSLLPRFEAEGGSLDDPITEIVDSFADLLYHSGADIFDLENPEDEEEFSEAVFEVADLLAYRALNS